MKRFLYFGPTIVAIALAAGFGCTSPSQSNVSTVGTAPEKISPPTNAKAERRDIVGYALMQGTVVLPPQAQAVIYPPYQAPVEKVLTAPGQFVRRGSVLIQLSFPDAESAYKQAAASEKLAETAYADAERQSNAPVRQAQQALAKARVAERQIRTATSPGGDGTTLQQAQDARTAAEQAVQDAQSQEKASLQQYQDQLTQTREAMAAAKSGVKLSEVKAPIAGTITELNAQAGQTIGTDSKQEIVKIVNLGELEVKARFPASEQPIIRRGKNVVLSFSQLPDQTFDGRVMSVNTVAASTSGTTPYEALISIENDKNLIKPDYSLAWAGVKTGEVRGVIAVPVGAVTTDRTGKPTVQVLDNGKWTPRVVVTGMSDGKYTEVKTGLKEGETVQVASGSQ